MADKEDPFGDPEDENEAIDIDLGEDDDNPFYVPEGKYVAVVIDLEKTESKAGKPMLVWQFAITDKNEAVAGKELKLWTVISPRAMWKLRETAEGLGLIKKGDKKLSIPNPSDAVGIGCIITVKDNQYDGRTVSSIQSVEAHPKGAGFRIPR